MSGHTDIDTVLPGRDTAWNPEAMKGLFEGVLRTRGGEKVELDSCHVERFRYRRGKRVVALYELQRCGPAEPRSDWVTGVLYPGSKSKRLYAELESQAENSANGDSSSLHPAAYVPELDMALQVFPLDRQLGSIGEIAEHPNNIMSRACGQSEQAGHGRASTRWSASLARYRPLQSATFAYSAEHNEIDERAYVKTYREGEWADPCERWQSLGAALREEAEIAAPQVLGADAQTNALVLGQARGTSLLESLRAGIAPQRAGVLAATALARLHGADNLPTAHRWKPSDVLENADRAIAFLSWASPNQSARLNEIDKTIRIAPDSGSRATSHLDVKVDHLFFDEEHRPGMIDIDTMDLADPIIDVATLAARLEFLHLNEAISVDDCSHAAHAFYEEYATMRGALPPEAFRSHYTNTVLQLALFATRHQREGWQDTVDELLTGAMNGASVYTR